MRFQDVIDLLRGKKELALIDSPVQARRKLWGKFIQKIHMKLDYNEKINVGFCVINDCSFAAKSIFEKMLDDKRFNPFIVVAPDVARGSENTEKQLKHTYDAFVQLYGKNVVFSSFDENSGEYRDFSSRMDIVYLANPYDLMTHEYYTIEYLSQKCLIFYISYYYFGKLKYDLHFMRNKMLGKIWKIFVENENSKYLFTKYSNVSKKSLVVSGYSKMDIYKNFSEMSQNKMIIIAPHHTVKGAHSQLNISNFLRLSDFFLRLPSLYPDIKFVFRPHLLLFITLGRDDMWGKEKVHDYIEKIKAIPNMEYQEGGEYFETFAKSSALIHDCGSFMAEYLYTSHPQCFILENQKAIEREFLPFGKRILKNVYKAYTEQNILDFIDNVVVKGNDYMKEDRLRFAKNEICYNYPHATEVVIENLVKL